MDNPALELNETKERPASGSVISVHSPCYGGSDTKANGVPPDASVDPELEEVEKNKQRKRDRKPLLYCKLITSYPKSFFFLTFGIHMLMIFIMVILMQTGYDIFPIVFDRIPLDIQDNEDFLRGLAWEQRNENTDIIERGSSDEAVQDERSQIIEAVAWFYESDSGNVFTKSNLQSINATEQALFWDNTFQSSYCHLSDNNGTNTNCSWPDSVIRFFDGTYSDVDAAFDDPNFDNIVDVIYKASVYNETKKELLKLLSTAKTITNTTATCAIIRGSMAFGYPFAGYSNVSDQEDAQKEHYKSYLTDTFQPEIDQYYKNGVGELKYAYTSGELISIIITNYVYKDMALLVGSLLFIFIFMSLQTWSLWITGFALISIVTSFCATNLVYRIILDFRYIGIFHILALFIILGIGADDVFVFVDTWKETAHNKYISLAHRMSDCYRRAALAMMYTSLTTAIAFIVSATSPFMGVNTFGVFAGLLVFVNYCSVIIFFPTVVTMYHLYFERFKCCCCCPKKSVEDLEKPADTTHHRKNPIVRFFKGPYFRFVTHKIARWFILAFFAIKIAVFCYFASTIQVNEEQTEFLPDSTNTGKWLLLNADFGNREFPLRLFLVFGLKPQDLSNCHHTNSTCYGNTVWDDNFDINENGVQQALLDLCTTIKGLSDDRLQELRIKKDDVTMEPQVLCFMEEMASFLDVEEVRPYRYASGTDFSTPLNETDVSSMMTANDSLVQNVYNTSLLPSDYSNWFEIGASFWLYNGFSLADSAAATAAATFTFNTYSPFLGESEQSYTIEKELPEFTYKYGTKMKYAAIVVNTSIIPTKMGYPEGLPIRDSWETFIDEQVATMPAALKGGFQATPEDYSGFNLWHWLEVQKKLVTSAVTGICIGIGLALPILILATMNVFVGLLATLTILLITLGVVGFIPICGFKLGMLESLNLVLVVGLAVDYCVHLAEGYSRSDHKDRKGRLQDALEEVGISVLSGACTTLGASFFMLFATILFFTQFGIFMFCTIGLSILYSLGFFVTVLGLIGPENNIGSLKPLFDWCFSKCCKCCKDKDTLEINGTASTNPQKV